MHTVRQSVNRCFFFVFLFFFFFGGGGGLVYLCVCGRVSLKHILFPQANSSLFLVRKKNSFREQIRRFYTDSSN